MDFCRNVSVAGGIPSEYPPEQVLAPPCTSKLGGGGLTGSLDDLFSGHNTEVDVSLEWLSIFVEDCFSSTGHCLPGTAGIAAAAAPTNLEKNATISTSIPKVGSKRLQKPQENHYHPTTTPSLHQKFVFPSKARSKRRRASTTTANNQNQNQNQNQNNKAKSWAYQLNHNTCSTDPPLLQQAYWLADSELILPPKKEEGNCNLPLALAAVPVRERDETKKEEIEVVEDKEMVMEAEEGSNVGGGGQARRCTHCLSQRTPQWRAGPLGPKTLCNACGVRYKSGRLLPEYRPAKSPTFVSYLHSNSHKKVLEMRMAIPSP